MLKDSREGGKVGVGRDDLQFYTLKCKLKRIEKSSDVLSRLALGMRLTHTTKFGLFSSQKIS